MSNNKEKLFSVWSLHSNHLEPPFGPFGASIRTVWSLQTPQDYWTEGRFPKYAV